MPTRLKSMLVAGFLMILLSVPAAAQDTVRIPLDWEPDPDRPSAPVMVCICGCQKIVGLIGGTDIRERLLSNSTTARVDTRGKCEANPVARCTTPFVTSFAVPAVW